MLKNFHSLRVMNYDIDTSRIFAKSAFMYRILGVNFDSMIGLNRSRVNRALLATVGFLFQGILYLVGSIVMLSCILYAFIGAKEGLSEKVLQFFLVVMIGSSIFKVHTVARNAGKLTKLVDDVFIGVQYPPIMKSEIKIFSKSCNSVPRGLYIVLLATFILLVLGLAFSRIMMIHKSSDQIIRSELLADILFPDLVIERIVIKTTLHVTLSMVIILSGLCHYGFAHLYTAMLILAQRTLEHVNRSLKLLHLSEDPKKEDEVLDEITAREILDYSIQQHQRSIRFIDGINETFSTAMLAEVWGIILIWFTVIYRIIKRDVSLIRAGAMIGTVLCSTLHFGTICYFAAEITGNGLKINDSCNAVSWWNWVPGFEMDINIMSIRAKDPLILKAGPFYQLNLKTLLTILELSVTYLLILLQFDE